MTEQLVFLLLGLYFIGVALPAMFTTPVNRSALIQMIYGIILVAFAFIGVHLLR